MDPSLEIRKLPTSVIRELVQTLEYAESWKRLMSIIPKTLSRDSYECKVTINNLPKYKSEHFKIIENASQKTGRDCTEILFHEWGTSGRVLPTLGHLLYLLKKAELFRAAEYVAVDLLKQEPPERPKDGPAAPVAIVKPDTKAYLEEILDQMAYPSSVLENVNSPSIDTNINYSQESTKIVRPKEIVIPKIVISESPDTTPDTPSAFRVPLVVPRNRQSEVSDSNNENVVSEEPLPLISDLLREELKTTESNVPISDTVSGVSLSDSSDTDMLKFSSGEAFVAIVPNLSVFNENSASDMLKFSCSEASVGTLPDLSVFNAAGDGSVIESAYVPAISVFMRSSKAVSSDGPEVVPAISQLLAGGNSETYVPAISELYSNTDAGSDKSSFENSETTKDIPLSFLLNNSSDRRTSLNSPTLQISSQNSQLSRNTRTNCVSPLPNLSLNTQLKQYSYCELEIATNFFDETPHKSCLDVEDTTDASNGRFLGSGAFGSVFLALGLSEKPIAIKKLNLNNAEIVSVDDAVTKQFKNEVEILCKYKHENLLSIVGYSCDGPTYCLMYEYISGGALKDRLQNQSHILSWKDRLSIALGTAKAVAYLHTCSTPPLIHRDIKSANILLDCSNKPKLCDFGLIKLKPNQNMTTSTTVYGTSAYMAPEAFRGDVSEKLDTFSFGVVVLELLTSLKPFDENRNGCDLVTYMQENCEDDDITPLLDMNAGSWTENGVNFGDGLYKIANRCLEEKKRRPDMVEVEKLIKEFFYTEF